MDDKQQSAKPRTPESYQPDPLLREGRSGHGWRWIVGTLIALALVVTFFAVTRPGHHVAVSQHATPTTRGASDKPPATALPTGRTSGHEALSGQHVKIQ